LGNGRLEGAQGGFREFRWDLQPMKNFRGFK
jgi:hypothetical protein